jgi:hypothetical protein
MIMLGCKIMLCNSGDPFCLGRKYCIRRRICKREVRAQTNPRNVRDGMKICSPEETILRKRSFREEIEMYTNMVGVLTSSFVLMVASKTVLYIITRSSGKN